MSLLSTVTLDVVVVCISEVLEATYVSRLRDLEGCCVRYKRVQDSVRRNGRVIIGLPGGFFLYFFNH